jgi:hypothetical protein
VKCVSTCASLVAIGLSALAGGSLGAQSSSLPTTLDAYLAGEFEAVAARFGARVNYDNLLDALRREGPTWIAASGPADRPRRELAAAT